ncbi:MAG: NifB/NifX family molybdenum-iron cluster-binding protein [Ignavibacteriaceae bacterium]|nr:NifB/NifX family molybdenum-iron cluster-binding protein [Ignavibacteriaceae bacterium]
MKIAVPSTGNTLGSVISSNLGHSPFILIYDDTSKKYYFLANSGFQIQDGSGLKAAEIIIQNNTDVLLTREIGRKAYSLLMKEHVDIHLVKSTGAVKSILNKYLKKTGVQNEIQ